MYRELVFGKVKAAVNLLKLQQENDCLKLVLAVSGGLDSVSLLHVMNEVARVHQLKLVVAHVNHKLRPTSDSDAEFVKDLAAQYQLAYRSCALNDKPPGRSIEDWAREERYAFLETVRVDQQADFILTAHHLNDQAETLLSRLLTGRLLSSAGCIAELDFQRKLYRPFLSITRLELEAYANELGLKYVEDPTNEDTYFLRNFIRKELLTTFIVTPYHGNHPVPWKPWK